MLLEQQVLLDAIVAYATVARDRRILELARANEERLRLEVDATRDREHFGDLTKTDILQAETRHAAATADRIAAEGELAVVTADYARIFGGPPDDPQLPPLPEALPIGLDQALARQELARGDGVHDRIRHPRRQAHGREGPKMDAQALGFGWGFDHGCRL
mgnify:CR=1 FL=1